MSTWEWIAASALILAFSAFLVFVDPLTIIADWLEDRRLNREPPAADLLEYFTGRR
ncbi:hypothetical protein [Mycobacterium malmoense]|uniref:hypothetical protein n=1 Tax=Mycobacterium malmoense TaxID=1780 RepID=UPI00159EDE9D|nr:hypothetical protein [Mycobacterium malmoense]